MTSAYVDYRTLDLSPERPVKEICWVSGLQPAGVGWLASVRTDDTYTVWRKHPDSPWTAITPPMTRDEHERWHAHRASATALRTATPAETSWLEERVAVLVSVTA